MRPNTEKFRKLFYVETNTVYKFFLLNLSVPLGIGLVYAFIVLTEPQQNPQELIILTDP